MNHNDDRESAEVDRDNVDQERSLDRRLIHPKYNQLTTCPSPMNTCLRRASAQEHDTIEYRLEKRLIHLAEHQNFVNLP